MQDQTVNIPLLRKAIEWAEAEAAKPPELCEWEQREYRSPAGSQDWGRAANCGTCYCVAGFVVALTDPAYAAGNGPWIDEARVAAKALGIDRDQASAHGGLFHDYNTIEDVRRIAEELAGERL